MSVIAGIVDEDGVWMASDSAMTEWVQLALPEGKVYRVGSVMVGVVGSLGLANAIQQWGDSPLIRQDVDFRKYLFHDWLPELRWHLLRHDKMGFAPDGRWEQDGALLVGVPGGLYQVYPDFSLAQMPSEGFAIGSGGALAQGALLATRGTALSPRERLQLALEVAQERDPYCAGPFHYLGLGPGGEERSAVGAEHQGGLVSLSGGARLAYEETEGGLVLRGMAPPWNASSVPLARYWVEGSLLDVREQVRPGAFRAALASAGDIRCAVDHDRSRHLGRTKNGTLTIWEDEVGLQWQANPDPELGYVQDLRRLIDRGEARGCSFVFQCSPDGEEIGFQRRDGRVVASYPGPADTVGILRVVHQAASLLEVGPEIAEAYPAPLEQRTRFLASTNCASVGPWLARQGLGGAAPSPPAPDDRGQFLQALRVGA